MLDLGLPKMPGADVLRAWRQGRPAAAGADPDRARRLDRKVDGFKAGADDYLTKPFRVEELVMRLRALVRRSAGHAAPRIVCGPLVFDAQTGVFELDGLPLRLTALEWRVLECLILRKDIVVERAELTEKVYEGDADADSNSLEVIIARLRRKIGRDADRDGARPRLSPDCGRRGCCASLAGPAAAARRGGLHHGGAASSRPSWSASSCIVSSRARSTAARHADRVPRSMLRAERRRPLR